MAHRHEGAVPWYKWHRGGLALGIRPGAYKRLISQIMQDQGDAEPPHRPIPSYTVLHQECLNPTFSATAVVTPFLLSIGTVADDHGTGPTRFTVGYLLRLKFAVLCGFDDGYNRNGGRPEHEQYHTVSVVQR